MNIKLKMVISCIRADLEAIEENLSLHEETNFVSRANALDFIDFHIIDRIEGLQQKAEVKKKLDILKQHAQKVKCELERIDINLYKQIREKISAGIYAGSSFMKMICKYLGAYNGNTIARQGKIGYDNLDVFINGILSDQTVPEATKVREAEMVFYQKTPARIIFEMVERAQLRQDDIFFDLGSGLGQVAILVNLISGAKARGIEYEPAYCNYAKACVLELNISGVEFINADARKGNYSQATIFFMYSPFEGSMLQDMLDILQKESRKRTIRIFTYGPCSLHVARQGWLDCVNGKADDAYKLYEFSTSLDLV